MRSPFKKKIYFCYEYLTLADKQDIYMSKFIVSETRVHKAKINKRIMPRSSTKSKKIAGL